MTPLDLIVGKLQTAGCGPSRTGPNAYEARCPAHNGTRKNLSIREGDDGRVLLHCHHAGENGTPSCQADAIVGALGLRMEDLFLIAPRRVAFPPRVRRSGEVGRPGHNSWKTLEAALEWGKGKFQAQTVTSWIYHAAAKNAVMAVGRFDAGDGEKTYRPFHRLPDGSWALGDPPGPLPLYLLDEIAAENGISICEGEKCVHALGSLDFLATTSAHGANSPEKTDWMPLAGKDVAILPDHDAPGEGYALALLRIFKRLDPRPRVRIIRLPDLGDGEDVADWLPRVMAGRSGEDAMEHARSVYHRLWNEAPVIDLDPIEDVPGEVFSPPCEGGRGGVWRCAQIAAPMPIPQWPDPPEDAAFRELSGMIVRLIEPTTEADPAGLLLHLIVGFGNAVGRGTWVEADGHRHHANEFVCCVGDTSRARKGTSWHRIRPVLACADCDWADQKITGGLSSGEGLIWEIRDEILGPDGKSGQPVVIDPGVSDKRLLVVESEFGNVLRVLSREGNTLSSVLRLGWDGDNLRTMVKNSPSRAKDPHLSLIGHITQQELTKYLSAVEVFNGMGNRILWGIVHRSKRLPFGGSCDQAELVTLGNVLGAAIAKAKSLGPISWSPCGRKLWEAEYSHLTADRPGLWAR